MSRDGKVQLCGYFDKQDAFTVTEVLGRVSRKRNRKITMNEAVTEAVGDWCQKHGLGLPSRQKKPIDEKDREADGEPV